MTKLKQISIMEVEKLENIKLYNADCMEVMKTFKDKQFSLAICDPPYGIGADINSNGNRCASRNGFSDLYLNHTSKEWNIAPSKEYFDELFRVSKNQIIWGSNHFSLPPTPSVIVWNKMQRNFSFGDGELAWCSIGGSMKIVDISRAEMQREKRIHITQKPIKLYKWLLQNYAKQGDKILDTHFGSLSIGIACHDLGFELTACELDKDYYEAGKKRLKQHQSQLTIF